MHLWFRVRGRVEGRKQPMLRLEADSCAQQQQGVPRAPGLQPLLSPFQLLQGRASEQTLAAEVKLPQVPGTSRWQAQSVQFALIRPDV